MIFTLCQAQLPFTVGIKGGGSFSSLQNLDNDRTSSGSRTGFVLGAYARVDLPLNQEGFYIQPELVYAQKGGKLEESRIIQGVPVATEEFTVKVNTIDIPILFGYQFAKIVRLNLGPVISPVLKATLEGPDIDGDIANQNSILIGFQLGGGVSLNNLEIDLRYELPLSKVSNDSEFRTNAIQLTLGYLISSK